MTLTGGRRAGVSTAGAVLIAGAAIAFSAGMPWDDLRREAREATARAHSIRIWDIYVECQRKTQALVPEKQYSNMSADDCLNKQAYGPYQSEIESKVYLASLGYVGTVLGAILLCSLLGGAVILCTIDFAWPSAARYWRWLRTGSFT